MGDNVIIFNGITKHDLPVEQVLDQAKEAGLHNVVILGSFDAECDEEYFASSVADGGTVLWLLERLKHQLMFGADEE